MDPICDYCCLTVKDCCLSDASADLCKNYSGPPLCASAKVTDPVSAKGQTKDPVVPDHYTQYKIEPITFVAVNNIPFIEGNVIKYICRWRKKDGLQDLKKAKRYIDLLIEHEERAARGEFDKGVLLGGKL